MKLKTEWVLYAAMAVGLLAIAYTAYSIFFAPLQPLQNNAQNYQNLVAQEQDDICQPPPGTDPEQWRQHLSHHPDRYAKCLQ